MHAEIVVVGTGAVSALGVGCDALWDAIAAGRDGIAPIERFATDDFAVHLGAIVPGRNQALPPDELRALCIGYAVTAAREALEQAGRGADRGSVGLVLGTSLGDMQRLVHTIAEEVHGELRLGGACVTVSTACASSANALGLALDLLREGTCDAVLAGGTDILTDTVFAGFHALGVLNPSKCAPFGLPMGTTLGEGAGFVVLERSDTARARGAEPLAVIGGYGLSSDAFHATSPEPTGAGVSRAITAALQHARLDAAAVGYVNAHGSGTAANDRAEWQAIERVFGGRAATLPVSSVKSYIGHAQGAAGVLELIITLLAQQRGFVPPTLHCETRRSYAPPDPVAEPVPRSLRYDHAVCTSSAFGGANVALVLSGAWTSRSNGRVPPPPRGPIAVLGFGITGPGGVAHGRIDPAMMGPVAAIDINALVPMADPRELDDAALYLTAASAAALKDAGLALRGSGRDRAGLIAGTTSISAREGEAFERSVKERGVARCSTTAFARLVLNAAAGSAARLLSLRGPTSTLSTGRDSGLVAITYAALLLATRDDADVLVAGGFDALHGASCATGSDGAACVALGRLPADGRSAVMIEGYALGAAGRAAATCARALQAAGLCETDIDMVFALPADGPTAGDRTSMSAVRAFGAATRSAVLFAAAAHALQQGLCRRALVVSAEGESASAALVLRAGAAA